MCCLKKAIVKKASSVRWHKEIVYFLNFFFWKLNFLKNSLLTISLETFRVEVLDSDKFQTKNKYENVSDDILDY